MVGSPSPRSFSPSLSLSLPVADPGVAVGSPNAVMVMHVNVDVDVYDVGARVLAPRRNGRTLRAARAHPGLMMAAPSRSSATLVPTSTAPGNATGGRSPPASSSPVPVREVPVPTPVPVLAITCSAVGGVVALAVIFALVYVRRVRRRVKSMKRLTNVLGPGARISLKSRG